jgi:hypothetical protein
MCAQPQQEAVEANIGAHESEHAEQNSHKTKLENGWIMAKLLPKHSVQSPEDNEQEQTYPDPKENGGRNSPVKVAVHSTTDIA